MINSIFILDKSKTIVDVLSNNGDSPQSPFFDDKYIQDLATGAETFEFTTISNNRTSKYVIAGNYVAFKFKNKIKMFQIMETKEEHEEALYKFCYCEIAGLELINNVIREREIPSANVRQFFEIALADTDWKLGIVDAALILSSNIKIDRATNVYSLIQEHLNTFDMEIEYRFEMSGNRISGMYIDVYKNRGRNTGFRFEYGDNVSGVSKQVDMSELCTAMVGIGKDNIDFKSVEWGADKPALKPLNQDFIVDVEAHKIWNNNGSYLMGTYTAQTESPHELLTLTWNELQRRKQPKMTYDIQVEMLQGYDDEINIGDTVKVIDNDYSPALHLIARIGRLELSFTDYRQNKCILTNFKEVKSGILSIDTIQAIIDGKFPIGSEQIQDGAITEGKIDTQYLHTIKTDVLIAAKVEAEELVANKANIKDLNAVNAKIENLVAKDAEIENAVIDNLTATNAEINSLKAQDATIKNLVAEKASIADLNAANAVIGNLQANKADIADLNAVNATINNLKADVAEIDTLLAGNITADNIQSGSITSNELASGTITAGSGVIADGAIGSAQISSLDASKINAGTIDTSRVTVAGPNSNLKLSGNRLQVFNGVGPNQVERVSLGDVKGDGSQYGLLVRGADGKTVIMDENGVTNAGITDGAITNDKINPDANIDGAKLNINSVITKINEDGSESIQGAKIDIEGTSLSTKLSNITTTQTAQGNKISEHSSKIAANESAINLKVDSQTYQSDKEGIETQLNKNTADIALNKEQIALKVEQTDIDKAKSEVEGKIDTKVNAAKAEIKVTTDKISQNISNLTTAVNNKADGTTVSTLSNKVGSLETSVNGISGKVSSLETTTTTLTTDVAAAQSTANTAKTNASKAQTTANNAQATADANKGKITTLQGEVTTVKDNVATLDVNLQGITQRVSSTESTTATLTTKVNTAQSTANTAKDNASKAQTAANNAQNTADSKAKVFTSTPTTPYKVGDLWTAGPSGDVMRCKVARASGSYTASDWEKASKYTDDTKANAVDGKVNTLQAEHNTTKSKVAEIVTNLNSITQRVSSTESTTATLTTKVDTAQSTANTAKSTADAAKSAATNAQNSANNANNALSINQQTKMNGIELFNNEYKSNTSARPFTNGNYSVVVATEISGADTNESNIIKVTNGQILYTDFIACNINNPYYASIEVYNKDTNNGTNYIQVCYYDKNKTALASNEAALSVISGVAIPSANTWHKLEGWVNPPALTDVRRKAKYVRIRIINRYSGLAGITYWRNISWKQLGSGLLADTQETKTEIASTKSKVATIETNLSGITSRVSNVETKQSTTDGKVSSLETRMSTAESKITESAITNTVKKNFYTKSETDSAITSKGYQTASQVQQTVNGLQVKVSQSGGYNLIKNSTGASQNTRGWTCTGGATLGVGYNDGIGSNNRYFMYLDNGTATSERFAFSSRFKLKPNTKYTFVGYFHNYTACPSFDVFVLSSTSLSDTDTSTAYTNVHHLINSQNTNGSWKKFTATFTTPESTRSGYIRIDNNGYNSAGTNSNRVHWNALLLVEGELEVPWSPHPSEVYDGVTTIDKDGITITNTLSSTYTQIDNESFRVENNTGGTIAEFSQNSRIPNLSAGIITANEIYAGNVCSKSPKAGDIKFIYVNGSTGNDNNAGTQANPYKTVQRAIDDIKDKQDQSVTIYVYNSVPGFELKGITGTGVITFSLQDSAVINGYVILGGVTNCIRITNETGSLKATFKNGISIYRCVNVDIYGVTFRGVNAQGNNIYIQDTNYCAVNSCDLGGLSTQLLCAIRVQSSLLWIHGCRGSNITDVVGQYAFSHVMMARGGTSNVPDYTNGILVNYDGAGRIQNWTGGTFTKTPSSGWNPAYTPTQKTQTWSFNKIWSDETLNGWSDRQELIQGYASTWNTGRWTGYMQFTDGMAAIRSAISGGTNFSGRLYVQRRTSSGNSTGSKLCLYASDGTLITNSTTINRGQGVWVNLSSAIISKIASGAITYFYLKADANNTSTFFKCEANPKIEITYTK